MSLVDREKIALMMLKWPVYSYRMLINGRFAAIEQLQKDSKNIWRAFGFK